MKASERISKLPPNKQLELTVLTVTAFAIRSRRSRQTRAGLNARSSTQC